MLESEWGKQNREHDYYCASFSSTPDTIPPHPKKALASSVTPVPRASCPLCRPAGSLSAVHPPLPLLTSCATFYSARKMLTEETPLAPTLIMRVMKSHETHGWGSISSLSEKLKVLTWHSGHLKLDINKEKDSVAANPWPTVESKPHLLGATMLKFS